MDKSNKEYWQETLERYRASKKIRKMRSKLGLLEIGNLTGNTKQYVYGVREMTIKPNSEFLNKLEEMTKKRGSRLKATGPQA